MSNDSLQPLSDELDMMPVADAEMSDERAMSDTHSFERGQGLVEYALIIALVAIVVIAALLLLGPAIANTFNNITHTI